MPSHSFNKYGIEMEREFNNVAEPECGRRGGAGRGNGSSSSVHVVARLVLEV